MIYPDDLTLHEARDLYFRKNGFDDRTYTDSWVRLPVLGRTLYLPNIGARKKAVRLHDIDHVLTEYPTNWLGEFEISAYELGTGCGRYWAAWLINMQAVVLGALRAPKALIRAFARGRRSRGVYGFPSERPLLQKRVGELRAETTAPRASIRIQPLDVILFLTWFAASIALHLLPLVAIGVIASRLI